MYLCSEFFLVIYFNDVNFDFRSELILSIFSHIYSFFFYLGFELVYFKFWMN